MPSRISEIIADYRLEDGYRVTEAHVNRWLSQFPAAVREHMASEMVHVLKKSYFSKKKIVTLLSELLKNKKLAGEDPRTFWREVSLLEVQARSRSQVRLNRVLDDIAMAKFERPIGCASRHSTFLYLDDIVCSGDQLRSDLVSWIDDAPPTASHLVVVTIVYHTSAWWNRNKIIEAAQRRGIKVSFYRALELENKLVNNRLSQVVWPSHLPDRGPFRQYIRGLPPSTKIEVRRLPSRSSTTYFSSEGARDVLEQTLLSAGAEICSFPQQRMTRMQPLGYSRFAGLGFGTLAATYLNCPNNAPLALWWGDPLDEGTLGRWYPLMERRPRGDEE